MNELENSSFNSNAPDLDVLINKSNAGIWEFDINTNEVKWSDGFYHILGYKLGEIERSYLNFIDNLVYYEDRDLFLGSVNGQNVSQLKVTQIRVLTKRGYEWFQSTMQKQQNAKITGTLVRIHELKIAELQNIAMKTSVSESNQLIQIGGWKINCGSKELSVSNEGLAILEARQKSISLDGLVRLIEPAYKTSFQIAISNCIEHSRPFEIDLQIKTAFKNVIWVKIKAQAHVDQFGICSEINGIMQNIEWSKKKEKELETLLKAAKRQKDKLQNFAHIVAHNINSYAHNLHFMVNLYEQSDIEGDREEIFSHIKGLSSSLTTTIEHLNEIVKSEGSGDEKKSLVELSTVLNNTINALYSNIQLANASVVADFSECTHVYYLSAYLESIFHNMISNSLKYREPSRKTIIKCESKKINDHVYLIFEDNGIGINMEKHGNKLFGMYQTFHQNKDAHGLGLYITRNQVEESGGAIKVESKLDKGTKFIIRL